MKPTPLKTPSILTSEQLSQHRSEIDRMRAELDREHEELKNANAEFHARRRPAYEIRESIVALSNRLNVARAYLVSVEVQQQAFEESYFARLGHETNPAWFMSCVGNNPTGATADQAATLVRAFVTEKERELAALIQSAEAVCRECGADDVLAEITALGTAK